MQPAAAAARTSAGRSASPTGIEVAILDGPSNDAAARRTRGEVAIQGATVVDGYENNPAANEAAFTDGWFRTGDEGMLDEDGYLFLTGRLKEQINRGGEKISPLEIDEVAAPPPGRRRGVDVRDPPRQAGRGRRRWRSCSSTATAATEHELRDYLGAQLAAFKVPQQIVFVDEIPKGATGKLQRIGLAGRLGL